MVQPQAARPDVLSGSVSHAPGSTDLQAQILTDDPRPDLGATAESQQTCATPTRRAWPRGTASPSPLPGTCCSLLTGKSGSKPTRTWGYVQTLSVHGRGKPPGVHERAAFDKWLPI